MRSAPLKRLVIKTLRFDTKELASALLLKEENVLKAFRDGRVVSRFSEHWGAMIFCYDKHEDTNTKFSDGAVPAGDLGDLGISVKSLTESGVKFQLSRDTGSGRSCSQKDLVEALRAVTFVVVVDVTEFPLVKFIKLLAAQVPLRWAQEPCCARDLRVGRTSLTPSGLTKSKFYELLNEAYPDGIVEEDAGESLKKALLS